jgi:hypothetical protein
LIAAARGGDERKTAILEQNGRPNQIIMFVGRRLGLFSSTFIRELSVRWRLLSRWVAASTRNDRRKDRQ